MNYPENELTLNSLCCSSCRVITNPFCSTQWLTHSTVPEGAKSFFIHYCLLNDIASSFPCRTIRGRRSRIISTVVGSRFFSEAAQCHFAQAARVPHSKITRGQRDCIVQRRPPQTRLEIQMVLLKLGGMMRADWPCRFFVPFFSQI